MRAAHDLRILPKGSSLGGQSRQAQRYTVQAGVRGLDANLMDLVTLDADHFSWFQVAQVGGSKYV